MRGMAHESLASGAIGVSTGTAYPPAACASTEEIIEVCRPLTKFGGLYVTHMRNEDDAITDSMEETFRIGRELGSPVVISHHKCVGTRNHGRSPETLGVAKLSCESCQLQPRHLVLQSAERDPEVASGPGHVPVFLL